LFDLDAPLDMARWYAVQAFEKRVFVSGIFAIICPAGVLLLDIQVVFTSQKKVLERRYVSCRKTPVMIALGPKLIEAGFQLELNLLENPLNANAFINAR